MTTEFIIKLLNFLVERLAANAEALERKTQQQTAAIVQLELDREQAKSAAYKAKNLAKNLGKLTQ